MKEFYKGTLRIFSKSDAGQPGSNEIKPGKKAINWHAEKLYQAIVDDFYLADTLDFKTFLEKFYNPLNGDDGAIWYQVELNYL